MICKNCGSVLPDNATRCDVCGLKVPRKSSGVAGQRLMMVGIGAAIGLVAVGAVAVPAILGGAATTSAAQSARVASDLVTQNELVVPVQVSGLDASGSRIAVHVKGMTSGGTSVDQSGYVNNEGKGLKLEQGMYEVTVVGSPISSSGVIYNLPSTGVSVEVSAEGGSSYAMGSVLALTPIDAASVTDEQIEAARQWILNDPEHSATADQLAEAARQRRAAAQKAAEGTKKEETKEGETQSEQSNQPSSEASDSSEQSSDNSTSYSGQTYDPDYSYYDGAYAYTQYYSDGSVPESNSGSGTSAETQNGNASQTDTSQDSGQGGQQTDSAPSDGGSGSSGSGGSGSDQGSSPAQPANAGTNSGGTNATA